MLYAITSFLGAFLLFQVQPLIAKYILPWYGGTPAVWTTCMLFFQAVLLAGYAYAHKTLRPLPTRRQVLVHSCVLACAAASLVVQAVLWRSPLLADATLNHDDGHPVRSILFVLTLSVGLCSVVLAATSPLIQSWHARAWPDRSPYKLYALSNIGSLFALLSYPFVFEPMLTIRAQAAVWSGLFLVYAVLCAWCGRAMRKALGADVQSELTIVNVDDNSRPTTLRHFVWCALAGCGCLALLAITNLVCQEIAVVPFLWVVPLSLYLLTFIVCFEFERFAARRFWTFSLALLSVASAFTLFLGIDAPLLWQLIVYNATLFALCMVCHGELVRLRPAPTYLTGFYLAIAAGGCAGGLFATVIAPMIFDGFWEFHTVLVGVWVLLMFVLIMDKQSCIYRGERLVPVLLIPGVSLFVAFVLSPQLSDRMVTKLGLPGVALYYGLWLAGAAAALWFVFRRPETSRWHAASPRWPLHGFLALLCAMLLVLLIQCAEFYNRVQAVTRNFYGVLRVTRDEGEKPEDTLISLRHGAILHGLQFRAPEKRRLPVSYYSEKSGIGMACQQHLRRLANEPMRIGVIGLGVGGIAAYGQAGDFIRFYEINPEVTRIAKDTNYFTFVTDSPARIDVVHGDARLTLERELRAGQAGAYDIFVLDAFSSDSIPAHLLTMEAFEVYLQHLRRPGGWFAFNISNRHLDLRPVVRALADHFGLDTLCVEQDSGETGICGTTWIIAARRGELTLGYSGPNMYFNEDIRPVRLWTDDFSNLLDVLR